jgi:hypothetical protein
LKKAGKTKAEIKAHFEIIEHEKAAKAAHDDIKAVNNKIIDIKR